MKILVTGAAGMLGSILCPKLAVLGRVVPVDLADGDLGDFAFSRQLIEAQAPDVVVHVAAMTNVDACEERPEDAFRANVLATQNLAGACAGRDVSLVYLSSTGVYGKQKEDPWTEFDEPLPTTVHHKTKLLGERAVAAHVPKHLIVRTGWLFGGAKEQPKNFVWKRYLEAKGAEQLFADSSQGGNPTYVEDLAAQLVYLIEQGVYGLVNCVGNGAASRLEYVRAIVEAFGLPCEVHPAPAGGFVRKAPVSHNEAARNYRLDLLGMNRMRPWRDALAAYVTELKGAADGA